MDQCGDGAAQSRACIAQQLDGFRIATHGQIFQITHGFYRKPGLLCGLAQGMDLPASVATGVTMEVSRPGEAPERLKLSIDDAGEAWVAEGRPLEGDGVIVEVRYALQGVPHAIEVPVVASAFR